MTAPTKQKLRFQINGYDIFYVASDVRFDDDFVSFTDKFGKKYLYRKSLLIGIIPVDERGQQ